MKRDDIMKVVIFGTGKKFQQLKYRFREDIEIIAFLDNDPAKWYQKLDGILILPPGKVLELKYDYIYLLSAYYREMEEQLKELGVEREKIFHTFHIEKICVCDSIKYYGNLPEENSGKRILVFSHALTCTGAQNVLFIALQILHKRGYQIAVLSNEDGVLRDRITEMGIPVIIMKDSYFMERKFEEFVNWADKIIVNTLWLYYVVEELISSNKKVIWWIHESGYLKDLDVEIFEKINQAAQVSVNVVSDLVKRKIFQVYKKDFHINVLPYGLPEYDKDNERAIHSNKAIGHGKIIFAVIGMISYIKAQDIFIHAVGRIPKADRDNAEFWIVGSGRFSKEDMEYIEKYPCIKVIGEIDNKEIQFLYEKIDVVVCCSREDALPVVVTEGCLNKKLVIVSNETGMADYIINGKNGFVIPNEDIDQLSKLFSWVIEHKDNAKKIGCASKEVYDQYFSLNIFERNLLKVLEN